MKARPSRRFLRTLVLLLIAPARAFAEGDADPINDCGVNSLYLLLRLHARDVDLSDLRRRLPRPGEDGLSMADLQSAASSYGLDLRGERLRREDLPLDRPVVALLGEGGGGHFVVLRPVGTTGTMAMLFDFPRPPRVVDYDALWGARGWDGLALVPVRRRGSALPYPAGLAAAVAALLSCRLLAKRRGRARAGATAVDAGAGRP